MTGRKIIHIDMDAFYASIEQRDNPELRGKPIAVGHAGERGVVSAASYEARKYGVRSAMASLKAARLCPELIFVPVRIEVYEQVSQQLHEIFHEYTDLVEPLALDEAFLDVTTNKKGIALAVDIAREIKKELLRDPLPCEWTPSPLKALPLSSHLDDTLLRMKSLSDMKCTQIKDLQVPATEKTFGKFSPIPPS